MAFPGMQVVHFIGVGGVGMSGLATILLQRGVAVSGTDAADSPALERLARLGAVIHVGHDAAQLPAGADVAVYSSAVPPENPEFAEAIRRGLRLVRRGEFLAELALAFPTVVAVAGSHGKTTTAAMLAHILRETGRRPGHLIGGDVPGWAAPAAAGAGQILVTEVDESDGTQACLRSSHAIVTNVDDDHCWSLGGVPALEQCFRDFVGQARELFCHDDPTSQRLFAGHPRAHFLGDAALPAGLAPAVPGLHNRRNAQLALAVATALGVPPAAALAALANFPGVSRRLSERYASPTGDAVVIEDYAHHPAELRASLQGLRERYPGRRFTVIFQPHRFERVKRYAAEFATVLAEGADAVFLIPPFAAWRQDQDLADPRGIVAAIHGPPATYWEKGLEELAAELAAAAGSQVTQEPRQLFAVVGAGDVGRLAGLLRSSLAEAWLERARAALLALPALAGGAVSREKSWAELTTLGAGLARPLVVYPATLAQLRAALAFAESAKAPVAVLGGGSNLVGADWEPPRIWLCLRQGEFRGGDCRPAAGDAAGAAPLWRAGAGVTLRTLFEAAIHAGLPCAEFAPLAWIPGTLGGALRMNAGADGVCLGEFVVEVEGVGRDGSPWRRPGAALGWGYRRSGIPEAVIVTAATLRLPVAELAAAEGRLRESGERRRASQPRGASAGCVFRNPAPELPAGRLVDRAGCKGMVLGGASVSGLHANFILTEGRVPEKDFLNLLLRVRQQVFARTGVLLMPEVRFAGVEAAGEVAAGLPAPRVVVLKGGPSSERAISLRSGAGVAAALREAGYEVAEVEFAAAALPELPAQFDVVFPVLHGAFGEDGQIQALLEAKGIHYVGSGPAACKRIMDKLATKEALAAAGVPTAKWAALAGPDAPPPAELRFPVVVKPNEQGSSIGVSKVEAGDLAGWRRALQAAFDLDRCVFCEEFIRGTEITVGLLDGQALPVVEIQPSGEGRWYDFDAKYEHRQGHTEYLCPPQSVPAAVQRRAQELAERSYQVLGAKDLLRVDFIVDAAGTPWCLEANAIPGFTPTSLLPKAAKVAGISFPELCARLVKANL